MKRIISGGQTGADQGGLLAARKLGIETGGTAPLGWRTERGTANWLEGFGLVESKTSNYAARTEQNVIDSDATLVYSSTQSSPGTIQTLRLCAKHKKPCLLINPFADGPEKDQLGAVEMTERFLLVHKPQVLNIAGNRESVSPGIERQVMRVLTLAIERIRKEAAEENEQILKDAGLIPTFDEHMTQVWPDECPGCHEPGWKGVPCPQCEAEMEFAKGPKLDPKTLKQQEEAMEQEAKIAQEKLEREAKAFAQNKEQGNEPRKEKHVMKPKHDEFRPILCGTQLQPATAPVWGLHIVPIFAEDGSVADIVPKMGWIEVSKASEFRNLEGLQFATIDSKDAAVKAQCLWRYLRAVHQQDIADGLTQDEFRIPVGNIKKEDCILGVWPKHKWDAWFGCDVRAMNLWKVILPVMTPTGIKIQPDLCNIKTIRLRVLDALVTEEGYPEHDGDIVTKVWTQFVRHADLDENGMPKPGAKFKMINRNWQMRATGYLANSKKRMPVIKAKPYADDKMYLRMCSRFGYVPEAQDGFITKDNLKTLQWEYQQGDILEFPVENIRIVKNKMKDWSSSMGAQCVANSNMALTREILNAHGATRRAEIIRGATSLELNGIVDIMEADQEAAWDDAISTPIKLAFSGFVGGKWFAPRFLKATLYPRIESFWKDHGTKVQIDKDGYYLQGDIELDKKEIAYEKEHGERKFFVLVPKTSKFVKKHEAGDSIINGRDPNVGPSNTMSFEIAGFNDSHDCIVMSWRAIYAMYGDVDGDTVKYETQVANSSSLKFACLLRQAPGAKAPKVYPAELPTFEGWYRQHETIGLGVLKSAADTGSLDLTTRQIIEERLYAGNPMTNDELMEVAEIRQAAIDGMKWDDMGVTDGKELLIKNYGVDGKMSKLSESPVTYRLLRKDAGMPQGSEIAVLEERIRLVSIVEPHPEHPYYDYFMSLKGMEGIAPNSDVDDSLMLHAEFQALWKEACKNYKAGEYCWKMKDIIELGEFLHKHYIEQTIMFLNSYTDDKVRKQAFSMLRNYHRDMISAKCAELFTRVNPENNQAWYDNVNAARYQRQLVVYLGTWGFGKGTRNFVDHDGNECSENYGKGGGAMWHCDEEYILDIAEIIARRKIAAGQWPSMNPFIGKIKEALVRNREKMALKAAGALPVVDEEEVIQ